MLKELFALDNNYMVELNREWISTISEFKTLLRRDRGSKGDHDGRKKQHAQKEFTFIYHYCDFKSQFIDFPESERWEKALDNAGLKESEVDAEVKLAIDAYKELQATRSTKILVGAWNSIDKLTKFYNTVDLDERDLNERPVYNPKDLQNSIKTLGDVIKGLKDLEDIVKQELEEKGRIRGGARRGNREDVDRRNGTIDIIE